MAKTKNNIKDPTKYLVPALEKALDVLEALAHTSYPLSLTELSDRLGRTSSELFRSLVTLEARGYITKDETSGNYALSLKVYELAHIHPPVVTLLNAAARPMEKLAYDLHESCHLSVLRNGKMVVLSEALSPGQIRLSVSTGVQFPAVKTSSGRLLLAHLPDDLLEVTLDNDKDYQQFNKNQKLELAQRVEEIRETGVSTSENENHVGIRDAAVLVGNPDIGLTAALAITWLMSVSGENQSQRIIDGLNQCVHEITNAMGLNE